MKTQRSNQSGPNQIYSMIWPFLNDIAQRILTRNKREQFQSLSKLFQEIHSLPGEAILDFGCGTGIFSKLFGDCGLKLKYIGYDINENLTNYAQLLHPRAKFVSHKADVIKHGPYDYILSNCCFHHISDQELSNEFEFISSNLKPGGKFVLVDILARSQESFIHQLFMMMEQGEHIRSYEDYVKLLQIRYDVIREKVERSHFMSIPNSINLNDLGIFVCQASSS